MRKINIPLMHSRRFVVVLLVTSCGPGLSAIIAPCDRAAAGPQDSSDISAVSTPSSIGAGELRELMAKAAAGEKESQYALGRYYETQADLANSRLIAVKWYLRAHLSGDVRATSRLGVIYASEREWGVDPMKGLALIVAAAEQGHADSQALVGWCYRFGLMGDEKSTSTRSVLLRWLGIIGNEFNHRRWIVLEHDWSMNGRTAPLPSPAIKWFELAAKQGHLYAAMMLWGHFVEVEGFEADQTVHYQSFIEESNDLTTNVIVAAGMATDPEHIRHARELITRRLASSNDEADPDALRIMRNAYSSGMFVPRDEEQGRKLQSLELALRWRMRDGGDPNNLYKLSILLFEDGQKEKAMYWLELAAVGGHPRAQQELGIAYHSGRGVDQSEVLGNYWLSRAAEQSLDSAPP